MDSTNSVCSGKSSLSSIVDKPSILIHKTTLCIRREFTSLSKNNSNRTDEI